MRRKRAPLSRDRRRVRLPHRRRQASTPATARSASCTRAVQADAGPLQGLHRDPARQRLPVAAHHAVRAERHADRSADPHRGHASRRRGGHRRALAVQGRRDRGRASDAARARVAREPDRHAAGRQLRGVPRERQGRPVPRQGLRVHAARARSCACRAARPCVDFAYAVHTDVGNRCVAAKVDRRLVPLRTPLRNGQTVEIITAKGATPNPSWVNFVVTAKARAADPPLPEGPEAPARPSSSARGCINQALGEFSPVAAKKLPAGTARRGRGRARHARRRRAVREDRPRRAPRAAGRAPAAADRGQRRSPLAAHRRRSRSPAPKACVVSYARCCFPIPDDAIIALPVSGRGVVMHRENCVQRRRLPQAAGELAAGRLAGDRRHGCSASEIQRRRREQAWACSPQVAAAISAGDTNIEHVAVDEQDGDSSVAGLRAAGARPQAPGARRQSHPPHARSAASVTRTIAEPRSQLPSRRDDSRLQELRDETA